MSNIIKSEILITVICHCVKTVEKKGLSIVFTFVCLLCSQFHASIVCVCFPPPVNRIVQTSHCHQWSPQLLS